MARLKHRVRAYNIRWYFCIRITICLFTAFIFTYTFSTLLAPSTRRLPQIKPLFELLPQLNTTSFNHSSVSTNHTTHSDLCPDVFTDAPYLLAGKLDMSLAKLSHQEVARRTEELFTSRLALKHAQILNQRSSWKPSWCKARHRIAIVLPFLNRWAHLKILLLHLLPILRRQFLDYTLILAEQLDVNNLFNKGKLMNAAFLYAKELNVDCVFFHDIDMLPEDDRVPYGCPDEILHLGAFVDKLDYQKPYYIMVGGVLAFPMAHFEQVNGYSTKYWGWGGEDDDMGKRIVAAKLNITRPDPNVVRYTMIKHETRCTHPSTIVRKLLISAKKRYLTDGLRSKNEWRTVRTSVELWYHHLIIDVGGLPKEIQDIVNTDRQLKYQSDTS